MQLIFLMAMLLTSFVAFGPAGTADQNQKTIATTTDPKIETNISPTDLLSPADQMVRQAVDYLHQQQSTDGSWRSRKYGVLKSGQAMTPFVLWSLMNSGVQHPNDVVEKALKFIRSQINEEGAIGFQEPMVLEYPNYSTAYALMCLKKINLKRDALLIDRMQKYLISQQFNEDSGFEKSSPAYGGWGFGGQPNGRTGHMDISHTRRVLQALTMQPCEVESIAQVKKRTEHFLRMVQKHPDDKRLQPMPIEYQSREQKAGAGFDGGFYYSPTALRANKGRVDDSGTFPFWRSYASATCEGLMTLMLADVDAKDNRIVAAKTWLAQNNNIAEADGIPELHEGKNWRVAVRFNHFAVRGEMNRKVRNDTNIRNQLARLSAEFQQTNGSFINPNCPLMKEDDSILCTALAILATAE